LNLNFQVFKLAESTQKPFTIASVSEELDELSNYLSKTFRSFQTVPSDRQAMVSSSFRKDQVEDYRNEVNIKTADERDQNIQSENTYNPLRSYGKMNSLPIYEPGQGFRDAKPFKSEIGIQSEPQEIERKQASPEAKRAVEDYKRRKELEKRGYKDEPVESIRNFKENPSPYKKDAHNHFDNNSKHLEEYRSLKKGEEEDYHVELKRRTYSPNRSGGYGSRSNQIAENYYSSVNKKLVKEPSPTKKTLHDLYRHKPKSSNFDN